MRNAVAKLAKLGISAPWAPVRSVVDASISRKRLGKEWFLAYLDLANPSLPAMYSAIQTTATEQNRLSKNVFDMISQRALPRAPAISPQNALAARSLTHGSRARRCRRQ